jgi:hypothetical protein
MMSEKIIELLKEVIEEDKINKLKEIGYFKAPASSKYHLSCEGGLALHSYNVTTTMLKINDDMNLGLDRKEIILAGMFHDLSKVAYYKPNILKSGQQSDVVPYSYSRMFDLGHGAESIYLLNNDFDIKVPIYVAEAIYWHMGFEYPKDSGTVETLKKQPIDIMFVWLLQTADLYATWIIEREVKNEQ